MNRPFKCTAKAILFAALFGTTTFSAAFADAEGDRGLLTSRVWWADYGSSSTKPFGMLYLFGPANAEGYEDSDGRIWYEGRVKWVKYDVGTAPWVFMAWTVTDDGVAIIDHAYGREYIALGPFYHEYEFMMIGGNKFLIYPVWFTTRSPYTPEAIRRYFYY